MGGTIDGMTEEPRNPAPPEGPPSSGHETREGSTVAWPQPHATQWSPQQPPWYAGSAAPGPVSPWKPPRPEPRRPGWAALVGVAGAAAIVAGVLGGFAGGYVGSHGLLDAGEGSSYTAPTPQPGSTARPEGSIALIAARALPSVVTIEVRGADGGTGSGFVFDGQGHLITNNHVISGATSSSGITVVLANGKHVTGRVVGRDSSYDIAVLKVDVPGLTALPIGSSSAVLVGDPVIAVGAPLGLESTVTSGIVSALNRPVSPSGGTDQSFINAIQTDAAINPGNSGGPLLDMQGRVIGVNSAIAAIPGGSAAQSGSIGVGFSIPSDQMRKTAEQLIRTGKAVHPIIGVVLDTEYTGEGVRIAEGGPNGSAAVTRGGPADQAGIRPGDVVVEFEGRPVTEPDQLVVAIRAKNVGEVVSIKVRRGTREFDVKMTLQGASN